MAKSKPTLPAQKTMALEVKRLAIDLLKPHPKNPRAHPTPGTPEWETLKASLAHDYFDPIVWNKRNGMLVSGHLRTKVMTSEGVQLVDCVVVDYDEPTHVARMIAANKNIGRDDDKALAELLAELSRGSEVLLDLTGFTAPDLAALIAGDQGAHSQAPASEAQKCLANNVLVTRFGVPPFTVLDTKQGYWQERKRAWLSLGIQGETGRDVKCNPDTFKANYGRTDHNKTSRGISVFDPVLCELAYRWFCPNGGEVLDLFAGGAVRGIVAGWLGYRYTGIELRARQVEANEIQAKEILPEAGPGWSTSDFIAMGYGDGPEFTPIEEHAGYLVKREDAFQVNGVRGGKVRTCWTLASNAKESGKAGLTTAGSRQSPQVNIVAHIAERLGMKCVVHCPQGELSPEVADAAAHGAEIIQHKAGYNNVIIARAREYAEKNNFAEIPFGMEDATAVTNTGLQARSLRAVAAKVKRIVIPVGSGMSLAGLLSGMAEAGIKIPVLGVCVGADPRERLAKYAPTGWENMVTLVNSNLDYHDPAPVTKLGELQLDPIYEAKCLAHLQPGDLLWIVGIRATVVPKEKAAPRWIVGDAQNVGTLTGGKKFDLLFTCPPYFDLEVYSDLPGDMSNAESYIEFRRMYREAIKQGVAQLNENSFAVIVVGDIRDKDGFYRGFVPDTIGAFEDAGAKLYNEAILLTSMGTLPVRAGRQFGVGRKLGKAHQNVLVFFKGDPGAIKNKFPMPQMGELPEVDESDDGAQE